MAWGGIAKKLKCFFDPGTKVDAVAYQQIVKPHLKKIIAKKLIFQQDGARCHTAKKTLEWFKKKNVNVLSIFPARSPDLNPIEFMWSLRQRRLANFRCTSRSTKPSQQHGTLCPRRLLNRFLTPS